MRGGEAAGEPEAEEEQEAGRAEQEGQDEAGQHQEVRDALAPGGADLPGADEEVEGEVVHPAGERDLRASKSAMTFGRLSNPPWRAGPEGEDQRGVGDREERAGWRGRRSVGDARGASGESASASQPARASGLASWKRASGVMRRLHLDTDKMAG